MSELRQTDPAIADMIAREGDRQRETIELIASENFTSGSVIEAMGSVLTNKYAEGYPGKRYYGGCEVVDEVETLAIERARALFGAEHVNVQPHSGAQANMSAMLSVLKPGDRTLGLSLQEGGHLTHGLHVNFSGRLFEASFYGVDSETELLDYDKIRATAHEVKPKMLITGASAYSRVIDFAKLREIADEVGAIMMADIAHIAGIVAADRHPTSIGHAHITTSTTHKTLRGPRGGLIMTDPELGKEVDKLVFPGVQGGPLMHVIAAKAVAFQEALQPEFKSYIDQVLENAKVLAETLVEHGLRIVSGGTDNHLMLVDLTALNISGRKAERVLEEAGITLNKNAIPNDPRPPMQASGVRIGTPAMTSRGMGTSEMKAIGRLIADTLKNADDEAVIRKNRDQARELSKQFMLPGDPIAALS
ncbi:MAG: serine hydroxymethyltransferase [Thermomicrobiaceae bacterium]